jgi:hypothetical protein
MTQFLSSWFWCFISTWVLSRSGSWSPAPEIYFSTCKPVCAGQIRFSFQLASPMPWRLASHFVCWSDPVSSVCWLLPGAKLMFSSRLPVSSPPDLVCIHGQVLAPTELAPVLFSAATSRLTVGPNASQGHHRPIFPSPVVKIFITWFLSHRHRVLLGLWLASCVSVPLSRVGFDSSARDFVS